MDASFEDNLQPDLKENHAASPQKGASVKQRKGKAKANGKTQHNNSNHHHQSKAFRNSLTSP